MGWLRREPLPSEVVGTLPAGDRVLAWTAYDGGHLVATVTGLWDCPREVAPVLWHWDEIDRAEWVGGYLTVQLTLEAGQSRPVSYALASAGQLPDVVRDRVTASIVVNDWHRLASGGGVRVTGRRRAGEEGVRWLLAFDRESDAADPAARAQAAEWLRLARESVGEQATA